MVQHLPVRVCQVEFGPCEQTNEWKRVHALDKLRFLEESDTQRNDRTSRMMLKCRQEERVSKSSEKNKKVFPKEGKAVPGFKARYFDSEGPESKSTETVSYTYVCSLNPF